MMTLLLLTGDKYYFFTEQRGTSIIYGNLTLRIIVIQMSKNWQKIACFSQKWPKNDMFFSKITKWQVFKNWFFEVSSPLIICLWCT